MASTEAVSGGKSVGIGMNVLGRVAFLGYKASPSLKTFRHCFIQYISGGDTLGGVGACSGGFSTLLAVTKLIKRIRILTLKKDSRTPKPKKTPHLSPKKPKERHHFPCPLQSHQSRLASSHLCLCLQGSELLTEAQLPKIGLLPLAIPTFHVTMLAAQGL